MNSRAFVGQLALCVSLVSTLGWAQTPSRPPPTDSAPTRVDQTRAVELVPAFLIGMSLGSEAEESCNDYQCSKQGVAWGGVGALRLGVEFARKMRFELAAGAIYLTKQQDRRIRDDSLEDFEPVTYQLEDRLRVRGPYLSTGLAFRQPLSVRTGIGARLHVAATQTFSRQQTEGTMENMVDSARAEVGHSNAVQRGILVFGWPELFVDYRYSMWRFGAGLGAVVIMNRAPIGNLGEIGPQQPATAPCESVRCAPPSSKVEGERPFGPSVQVSISTMIGLAF